MLGYDQVLAPLEVTDVGERTNVQEKQLSSAISPSSSANVRGRPRKSTRGRKPSVEIDIPFEGPGLSLVRAREDRSTAHRGRGRARGRARGRGRDRTTLSNSSVEQIPSHLNRAERLQLRKSVRTNMGA